MSTRTPTADLVRMLEQLAADINAAEPGGGAPIEEAAQRMTQLFNRVQVQREDYGIAIAKLLLAREHMHPEQLRAYNDAWVHPFSLLA